MCLKLNSSAYINCPNEYKCPNGSKLKNFLLPKVCILRFWIATSGHFSKLKIDITHYPWVYSAVGRVEGTREVKERELEGFSLKMFPAFAASFTIPSCTSDAVGLFQGLFLYKLYGFRQWSAANSRGKMNYWAPRRSLLFPCLGCLLKAHCMVIFEAYVER